MGICVQAQDVNMPSTGYFFNTLQNLRSKIIPCNNTPQSFAFLYLDFVFKDVLRILIVQVVLIVPQMVLLINYNNNNFNKIQ